MATLTAESILPLIVQLSPPEQAKLRGLWEQQTTQEPSTNGHTAETPPPPAARPEKPRDKRLPNRPTPPSAWEAMEWIAEHRREYAGQWVALDGKRLIAASPNHEEVFAAADADGAVLPMTTFLEDPDNIVHILWA